MNPTILLVDVASPNREEWRSFLSKQGCEVETAATGAAAVGCCQKMQPDLVLLHDNLPDIGGFELCRELKKDPLNQLTAVLLVRPSPNEADMHCGAEAGAIEVWDTPTCKWDALSRIQTVLRLRSYMEEQAKSAIFALAQGAEAKHHMAMSGHSKQMVDYAEKLGEGVGLGSEDLRELRLASWLHDIGKVTVPERILQKRGALSFAERRILREHPVTGEKICAPLKSLRKILPVIRHHHERLDGSGYPDNLRGEEIPLKARILQVADVYDALTTDRPYRGALPQEEALGILETEARQGWLDGALVARFVGLCRTSMNFPARERTMLAAYYA